MQQPAPIPILREHLARLSVLLIFFVPLLATVELASGWVNVVGAACLLVFTVTLLPEVVEELRKYRNASWLTRIGVFFLLTSVVGWIFRYIPIFGLYRTWVYLALPLFALAMIAWLRRGCDERFYYVYRIQMLAVLLAAFAIAGYLLMPGLADEAKTRIATSPPIFRNIRHFNYELALMVPLLLHFWPDEGIRRIGAFLMMGTLGYFSVWSAGRGQAVALFIFFVLILGSRAMPLSSRNLWQAALAFGLGGVFVFVLGETYLLDNAVTKTLGAETLDRLSSGRVGIWMHTLESVWRQEALLFGMGPDATLRLGTISAYVHPHNFVVQFIAEFGLVGTAAILLLLGRTGLIACKLLLTKGELSLPKTVAALFLSTLAFALIDGQFYHILPLTMIVVMACYLGSQAALMTPVIEMEPGNLQNTSTA